MARVQYAVCPARAEHEVEATRLWEQSLIEAGASAERAARTVADGSMARAIAREDVRIYLARSPSRYVGYLVLTCSPLSGLSGSTVVRIDQLYVEPQARRRGVARALIGAAARHAEQIGAEQIISSVPAQQRHANRFFARLGFGSHIVHRVTGTAALRRRLAQDASCPGAAQQVLMRRRSLRARAATFDEVATEASLPRRLP